MDSDFHRYDGGRLVSRKGAKAAKNSNFGSWRLGVKHLFRDRGKITVMCESSITRGPTSCESDKGTALWVVVGKGRMDTDFHRYDVA